MASRSSATIPLATAPHDIQEFAALGRADLGYVRMIDSGRVREFFPQVPPLEPGTRLFALFTGDGTPVALADSHAAAVASAWSNDLSPVTVQ